MGDRTEGRVGLALPAPKSLPESLIEEMLDASEADSEAEGSTERHEEDEIPNRRKGFLRTGLESYKQEAIDSFSASSLNLDQN